MDASCFRTFLLKEKSACRLKQVAIIRRGDGRGERWHVGGSEIVKPGRCTGGMHDGRAASHRTAVARSQSASSSRNRRHSSSW